MAGIKRKGSDAQPAAPASTEQAADGPAPTDAANAARASSLVLMGRLLKLSNLVTRPFFVYFADRYALSLNELRVLMTLATMREAAAHEIGKAAGMHPMNVSRAVAALMRAGRIAAQRDPANRRRKILTLTPKGRELQLALTPHARHMADFLFDCMSPLEGEFFSKLLGKLIDHLDAVDPESPLLIDSAALGDTGGTGEAVEEEVKPRRAARAKKTTA